MLAVILQWPSMSADGALYLQHTVKEINLTQKRLTQCLLSTTNSAVKFVPLKKAPDRPLMDIHLQISREKKVLYELEVHAL